MFGEKTIAVVVPAHNEERLIAEAVSQVPDYIDYVIVVDDASTDNTWRVLDSIQGKPSLFCMKHKVNRGVGGAIVTGYKRALELGADVVVVMAGDAQMDPGDLHRLLGPVVHGEADYAKGDRLSWPGVSREMPTIRFIGNHILTLMTKFASGYTEVRDSQCGYTAVSAGTLTRLELSSLYQRYGFPNDILAHLHTAGARLAQVSVRPIYGQERSGISLFTACIGVPGVLLRSFLNRRRQERNGPVDSRGPMLSVAVNQERR
ncbi:MAG: glycosyltransferase family 2 protein [Deltaproteobacteria bacterium]|nr:glycosyltransferase family 2 protein [Deltaproteobacteria bacterium]